MADNRYNVSAAIAAENTFTDWLQLGRGPGKKGARSYARLLVQSTAMSATLHLQWKKPSDADAAAVDDPGGPFTTNTIQVLEMVSPMDVRIGCKTGNFTSATALTVELFAAPTP